MQDACVAGSYIQFSDTGIFVIYLLKQSLFLSAEN